MRLKEEERCDLGPSGTLFASLANLSFLGGRKDGRCHFLLRPSSRRVRKSFRDQLAPGRPWEGQVAEPGLRPLFLDLQGYVCVWLSTLHLGHLVGDRLGSAPNDRDLCLSPGAVVWEGRSAWKALGPMPWFSKWVRPLGWGVLEQGHAALARLGRDGRNGKIEEEVAWSHPLFSSFSPGQALWWSG